MVAATKRRRRFTLTLALAAFAGALGADDPSRPGRADGGANAPDSGSTELAREVHDKGWIVYGSRTAAGDWDLFTMRPDGSDRRNLTNTPEFNEGLPRLSLDGTTILYRRILTSERFDNNRHGIQGQLVLMKCDGTHIEVIGKEGEFPWASWSPDAKKLACLSPRGIDIYDIATKNVDAHLDRKGTFQQLTWSPDGKWLSGVANSFDTGWSVVRIEVATGAINPVSNVDCCTPDWSPDSRSIVYSYRPHEWTQLWIADATGDNRRLVFAEYGRHIYGGCVSPDGHYVLFTGNKEEDGDAMNAGAPMGLLRLRDAPTIAGISRSARKEYPDAKAASVLKLPPGWEPHWTLANRKSKP